MLAAAAGSGEIFATTGGGYFTYDDIFEMAEVLPRKAKIAEMKKDEKLRFVMVSLEAKEQKILEEKRLIEVLWGNELITLLKWQGLTETEAGNVDEKR